MKHVLLISRHFPPELGGTQVMAAKFLDFMRQKHPDTKVTVLTLMPQETGTTAPAEERDGNIVVLRKRGWADKFFTHILSDGRMNVLSYFAFLYFFRLLAAAARRHMREHADDIDVVYGFGGMLPATIAVRTGRRFRKRVVTHYHIPLSFPPVIRWTRPLVRRINNRADAIVCYSESSADSLHSVGVDADRLHVVRNWIDSDTFSPVDPMEARRKLGLSEGAFVVLFAGRFSRTHGVHMVARMAERIGNALFVFVGGNGDYHAELQDLVAQYDNVKLFPRQDQVGLAAFYSAADVFAWSAAERGTFGLTTYESWSCGTPVLVPRASPQFSPPLPLDARVAEQVDGKMGLVFELDDAHYQAAVEYARNHRQDLAAMGATCRDYVLEHCSLRNADRIYSLLAGDASS